MDYTQAQAYLDSFVNYERSVPVRKDRGAFTLKRIEELAARLGQPHLAYPTLHVAGTKGKGSCCAFAASILRAAGLKVGLYSSPHLVDLRERITVNGHWIEESAFVDLLEQCRPHLEEMRARKDGSRRPTYFEIMTHLAFLYFARERVDVAVIEVGLGGRLDATSIVQPVACGITQISFDHMAFLGDTLDLIAREKAGIFKAGVPATSAPQAPEAAAALQSAAQERGTPLECVGRDLELSTRLRPFEPDSAPLRQTEATLQSPAEGWRFQARLGLAGTYQSENWAVAVRLAQRYWLKHRTGTLPAAAVQQGSAEVHWPGRLEFIPREAGQPLLFLDGAHNEASMDRALGALRELRPDRSRLVVVLGCAKDKDHVAILKAVARHADALVLTQSQNPRARSPEELTSTWLELTGRSAPAYASVEEALSEADRLAGDGSGLVAVTGSLYLVGLVRRKMNKRP
ncbi:MAG: folylpolyglutamate synthase [Planctomycetota bacterium]